MGKKFDICVNMEVRVHGKERKTTTLDLSFLSMPDKEGKGVHCTFPTCKWAGNRTSPLTNTLREDSFLSGTKCGFLSLFPALQKLIALQSVHC